MQENIAASDETGQDVLGFGPLEIDGDQSLVAVVVGEQRDHARRSWLRCARHVPIHRLDLHDLGPEVREDLRGIGAEHDRADLQDANAT